MEFVTQNEVTVLALRDKGYTYKQIGEEIGRSPERARTIHIQARKKARFILEVKKNWQLLFREVDKNGLRYVDLRKMVTGLKSYGVTDIRDERLSDQTFVESIAGFGPLYTSMVMQAHKNYLLRKPR